MGDNKNQFNSNSVDDIIQIDFDLNELKQVSQTFFEEAEGILEDLDQLILRLEKNPQDELTINQLFRKVNTLKGAVGAVPGGQLLGSLAHEFEALLSRIKKEKLAVTKNCIDLFLHSSKMLKMMADSLRSSRDIYPEELSSVIEAISRYSQISFDGGSSVEIVAENKKVSSIKLEKESLRELNDQEDGVWLTTGQLREISQLAGELLVLKNMQSYFTQVQEKRWQEFSQGITRLSDQLQGYILQIRKEPAGNCFKNLPVLVRQTSSELNKEIDIDLIGMETLIDKSLGSEIYKALVHLVRNSMDHGIEDVFDRTTSGKNPRGKITCEVSENSGVVVTKLSDDGRGLDVNRIRQRAIERGLMSPDAELTESEIYQFIFQNGFSTKDKITTVSGRGVGMDVVKTIVDKYGGKIDIQSKIGEGTTFILSTPTPQNIMVESTLICSMMDTMVAVPLAAVAQIKSCDQLYLSDLDGMRWAQIEGHTVPLMTYQEYCQRKIFIAPTQVKAKTAVVMRVKEQYIALLVDRIEQQSDLVIKELDGITGEMPGFRGTSVLTDEKIAYIVDPEALLYLLFKLSERESA